MNYFSLNIWVMGARSNVCLLLPPSVSHRSALDFRSTQLNRTDVHWLHTAVVSCSTQLNETNAHRATDGVGFHGTLVSFILTEEYHVLLKSPSTNYFMNCHQLEKGIYFGLFILQDLFWTIQISV